MSRKTITVATVSAFFVGGIVGIAGNSGSPKVVAVAAMPAVTVTVPGPVTTVKVRGPVTIVKVPGPVKTVTVIKKVAVPAPAVRAVIENG